jgi:membrane fusion protein, heavy metal efflux system
MMKTIIKLILVFCAAGCGFHDHSHDALSGEDEDTRYILTGYGNRYEVFAEAEPLVEGTDIPLLVHVTDLEDFSPLQQGNITAILYPGEPESPGEPAGSSLSVPHDASASNATPKDTPGHTGTTSGTIRQEVFSQSSSSPSRPGIWNMSLQSPPAGIYRLEVIVSSGAITDTITFPPLEFHSDPEQAIAMAHEQDAGHPAAIPFTKEQSWVVDFQTMVAEKRHFGPVLKTVGTVMHAHGNEITLTARTSGIVTFAGRPLYEGIASHAGERLMEIQGGTLAEGNISLRYNEVLNNYQQTKAEFERLSILASEMIISQRDLFRAETAYRNAEATYEMMRDNFSESGQPVIAPFGGNIRRLHVSNGQHVDAGQPLVSLARDSELVIRAEVQQRHAHALGNIYSANIGGGNGNTYTLEELGGKVLSYARGINGTGHLLPVHLGISDRKDLVPGSVVDVYLMTRSPEKVLAVPLAALMEEQGNYFVFVQLHPESFEKRQVERGSSDGLLVEISGGLREGERIVTRGATMIRIAAAAGTLDPHAGHTH